MTNEPGGPTSPSRPFRWARIVDVVLAVLMLSAGVFMAVRSQVRGTSFIFPSAAIASVVFLATAGVVALGLALLPRLRSKSRIAARVVLYCVAATYLGLARGRIINGREDFIHWPPQSEGIATTPFAELSAEERAVWALRIVTHYLGSPHAGALDQIRIPENWPMPPNIMIAVRSVQDTIDAWAYEVGSTSTCTMRIAGGRPPNSPTTEDPLWCTLSPRPQGVTFAPLARQPAEIPAPVAATTVDSLSGRVWLQYRRDGSKSGAVTAGASAQAPWQASIDGEVRSSAAAAGDAIVVGTHGTGALAAFDQATGRPLWRARAPNWIHQDPVSDGHIVVAGFGENSHQIPLHTPAGVAAYDLATGARRWTHFDESAVMTSPVIRGADVVYISEGGVARKRSLATGELVAELQLPGSAVMAPPAAQGDTLVAALENNAVCLVVISTMKAGWCANSPDLRIMGHSGPTVSGQRIFVSGHVPLFWSWREQLSDVSLARTLRLLMGMTTGQATIGGQSFRALDLRDGHELWRSKTFAARRLSLGHISGTATIAGDVGVIVLPLADTVVAFDVVTGASRWTAPGHGSRGAPLVIGEHLLLTGADGWIEVRKLMTGSLECKTHTKVGYDRAGPTMAGELVVFADIGGNIESFRREDVLRCAIDTRRSSTRQTTLGRTGHTSPQVPP